MTVAYSPGGGNDTVARLMAKHIEPYLGVRMVVENTPGAGGQIGFTRLAKSKPDGYTIGLLSSPSVFMIELMRKGVEYTLDDFQPIANIQSDPIILAVNEKSDITDFASFINKVKEQPGKLNVGGDGPQSNVHLQAAALEDALGVDVNFISYSGSGPASTGLLGNEVQAALLTASSALQLVESGRIRPLAIFSKASHPSYPNTPTATEAAGKTVPGVGTAIRGVAAPKGLAPERIAKLQDAFQQLLADPEFQAASEKMGVVLTYMGAEEFEKELQASRTEAKQYIDLMK
ncbi:tripartite tricarboxylate transporter substrate binding protein [Pollutimonas harenae]|nr:tripartite tricarboxylate transporter substrate binding protein [Pollutimonas harenae]